MRHHSRASRVVGCPEMNRMVSMMWPSMLVVLAMSSRAEAPPPLTASPSAAEQEFIARHWRRPIPPQGPPPARFSPIERSLQPEACGACHPVQFADWQGSIHARSMGPGIVGQLVDLVKTDPLSARSCATCPTPIAEQRPELLEGGRWIANPDFDAALQPRGRVHYFINETDRPMAMIWVYAGDMPQRLVLKTMRILGEQVLPYFRARYPRA